MLIQSPETIARGAQQGLSAEEIGRTILEEQGANLVQNMAMMGLEELFKYRYPGQALDIVNDLEDTGSTSTDFLPKAENEMLEPLVNGPYIRNGKPHGRVGVKGKAKERMREVLYWRDVGSDGILRDPNTGEVIPWKPGQPANGAVDIGHKSGRSYRSVFENYRKRLISLEEFRAGEYDPDNFQLELPRSNRGRKHDIN